MAIDLLHAFAAEPRPLDFVWPGFLAGTVGALIAPGGTGKSFWALEAAMAVSCSVAGGDVLGLQPESSGPVLYLAGDDPEIVLEHRIHAIGRHLPQGAREDIATKLAIEPVMGKRLDVMHQPDLEWLLKRAEGLRLIVIDTLTRVHRLDENDNSAMARLVGQLEYVCTETDAAILFLHHTSKTSAISGQGDRQQAARGASALIDNARWQGFLQRMTPDESRQLSVRPFDRAPIDDRRDFYLRFGSGKQNYGIPHHDRWYERKEGGVLEPVVEILHAGGGERASRRRGRLRSIPGGGDLDE